MLLSISLFAVPFEAEIIRANVYNDSLPRGPKNGMALHNQHLPDSCYLQTANKTFIDYSGNPVPNATKHRFLRVTSITSQAKLCPDAHFDSDGTYFATAFELMARNLSVSRALLRVWDDGEILAGQCQSGARKAYELDPEMVADYDCCSHLPNVTVDGAAGPLPNQRDWRSYASLWRLRITQRFRDLFMRNAARADANASRAILATAAYSEFEVEGSTAYFGRWPILREIMTPGGDPAVVTKATPRHPTVDMYVTHPREWDVGAGSWHGLDWLSMVLPSQIASGDTIYTPFVSPGWNAAEEKNLRPAQFLGLLKVAAATGAEWFYTGFFSPADDGQFARSQNWAWVAAMPAYAQATTQLWAELLGDGGTLLAGDTPMPSVNYNLPLDIPFKPISYRFWSGVLGSSAPVYIRQSAADPHTLLVVGTVQPQSSAVGNMPLTLNVSVQLPPPATPRLLTTLCVRRQGSVYLIKIEREGGQSGGIASIVQLDGWHEATHPSWWSHDVRVEAELHDAFRPTAPAHSFGAPRTEVVIEEAGMRPEADYSTFTTFVRLLAPEKDDGAAQRTLQYTVEPHCAASASSTTNTSCTCTLRIRLRRARGGDGDGPAAAPACVDVEGEAACLGALASEGRSRFRWVSLQRALGVPPGSHPAKGRRSAVIRVRPLRGAVDVDMLAVTECS